MNAQQQKPRYAPTGERIVRTVTAPSRAVLPYGTTILESSGERLTRTTEGWELINGEIVPTAGLDFPVRVLSTSRGYHQTRAERRATDRQARSAEAQAHRAEHPAKTTGRYLGPVRGARPLPYEKSVNGMTLRDADAHHYAEALASVGRGA